jgi:hypothetical protein
MNSEFMNSQVMNTGSGFNVIFGALLAVAFINALLSFVVCRAAKREENRVFALVALSVALWTLTNALFRTATSVESATLWAQLSYGAAIATAATLFHFAWVYPRHWQKVQGVFGREKLALYGIAALIAASAFVPGFVVRGIDLESGSILTGPGIYGVAIFMVAALAAALYRLLQSQSRLQGKAQAQARYVLYGSTLTATLGLVFNLFLPLRGNYHWVYLGPLCSLFFVGFSAYSIVAHHLFDVRLLIRRTVVYTLLLAALTGAFAAFEKGMEHLLRPLIGQETFATDLIAALLVGFAVDPLKRQLHHFVASKLFKDETPGDESLRDERG